MCLCRGIVGERTWLAARLIRGVEIQVSLIPIIGCSE